MTKKNNEYVFVSMAFVTFIVGLGMMIWSAISLSWMRLVVGIIFFLISMGYSYSWKDTK